MLLASTQFEGEGNIGGEHWIYTYFGTLAPTWSHSIGQVPAITGTIVRASPHSPGKAAAGFTASFIAIRQP